MDIDILSQAQISIHDATQIMLEQNLIQVVKTVGN